jgi:4'-phosphopantetheinyl transferase
MEGQPWPRLTRREIHVWKASLDDAVNAHDHALLSPDEAERAGRYRFARDRLRFVAGRVLLRKILGGYLGRRPSELIFSQGPHGKPRLALDTNEARIHFNVTHADSLALYAIARGGEVGIDTERIREIPDWARIAESFFAPRELARLWRLPADRRAQAFFRAWTRREAIVKASGDGLTGGENASSLALDGNYRVRSLAPAPGFLATLASGFRARRVTLITWLDTPCATDFAMI